MKISKLDNINKLYFTTGDIARVLAISPASARVSANRYAKEGYILRVKRGVYVLKSRWNAISEKDLFTLANMIQVPSYVSLSTALSYYGVTTQLQQGYIESVALKRTKTVEINGVTFNYTRINKNFYDGFTRVGDVFMASAEKAFLDVLYLSLFGKYAFDMSSIDMGKLDRAELKKLSGRFPPRVKKEVKKWIS